MTVEEVPDKELYQYLANVIIHLIKPLVKENPESTYLLWTSDLGYFCRLAVANGYPWNYVKKLVSLHFDCNQWVPCISFLELMELYPCEVINDNKALEELCDKVIADNPKSLEDYRKGKTNSINHLKGQVMKLSKGKADIRLATEILEKKLKA